MGYFPLQVPALSTPKQYPFFSPTTLQFIHGDLRPLFQQISAGCEIASFLCFLFFFLRFSISVSWWGVSSCLGFPRGYDFRVQVFCFGCLVFSCGFKCFCTPLLMLQRQLPLLFFMSASHATLSTSATTSHPSPASHNCQLPAPAPPIEPSPPFVIASYAPP